MTDSSPSVTAKWVHRNGPRRVRLEATRGAVTTEATLTEAEAHMLLEQLEALLGSTANCEKRQYQGGT